MIYRYWKVIATDNNNISLNGAKKGDATSTAIMFDPSGSAFKRGKDNKLYNEFEKGVSNKAQMTTDVIIISNLFLSSKR